MIAIADYGVGNIFSLKRSLEYIGVESVLTEDPEVFRKAEKLILPGVGAFPDAIKKLEETGFAGTIKEEAKTGKPLLGICLGMQLLLDESHEYGNHLGLGLVPGKVVDMKARLMEEGLEGLNLKIPQMGWNSLMFPKDKVKSKLFQDIQEGDHVYFVHSFAAEVKPEYLIAYTEYGYSVTAAVQKDNIMGVQFHPEKSGDIGLKILENFCKL